MPADARGTLQRLASAGLSALALARTLVDRARGIGSPLRAGREREWELFRQAERAAQTGSWRFDVATGTAWLSPGALRLVGLPPETGVLDFGPAVRRLVHAEDREGVQAAVERMMAGDRISQHEFRVPCDGGGERTLCSEGGEVVCSAEGRPLRVFGVLRDVTEARRLEASLRESEERYRGLFEDSPTVMLILDPEQAGVVDANPAACAFYGRSRDELRRLGMDDLSTRPKAELVSRMQLTAEGAAFQQEFSHRLANGEPRDVFVSSGPVRIGGRTLLHTVVHDVTEARRAEEAARRELHEANATLRSVIDATPLGVVTFDRDLRIRLLNPATREIFAGSAEVGEGVAAADLIGEEEVRAVLLPALEGRAAAPAEIERRRADGTPLALRAFAGPLTGPDGETHGVVALFEDATERRLMEETLRLAQKLEVLATVAGGVAHDFNNSLTIVLGNTERALGKLPSESPARVSLERALSALERSIALAGKMRIYAGGSHGEVGPLDLAALLRDDQPMLEASIPPHVTLQIDLPPQAPPIEASAEEIRQAVTALLTNAVEAIGGRRGKVHLRVSLRSIGDADGAFARFTGHPLPPGEYASLEVRDDGGGIRILNLPRVFDPFFTTKFVGRGLGLSAVLGIVRGHRGGIAVESTPGRGACFELVFPLLAPAA